MQAGVCSADTVNFIDITQKAENTPEKENSMNKSAQDIDYRLFGLLTKWAVLSQAGKLHCAYFTTALLFTASRHL